MSFVNHDSSWQWLNSAPLAENEWVHVAVTLAADTGTVYVNGSTVVSGTMTPDPNVVTGSQNWLGRSQYGSDPSFMGAMDELAVFQRALSPVEIVAVMNAGWDGPDGMVMGFHMEEDPATDGVAVADGSGLANNAILHTNPADPSNKSTTGHVGQALLFDGIDDYVSLIEHHEGTFKPKSFWAIQFWRPRRVAGRHYRARWKIAGTPWPATILSEPAALSLAR